MAVLLEIEIQIWSRAKLKNGTKTVVVDLYCVELFDHPPVIEVFMYLILPNSMLDVVVLDLLRPAVVKVVNLARHLTAVLQVVRFVNLRVAAFTKDTEDQVPVFQDSKLIL